MALTADVTPEELFIAAALQGLLAAKMYGASVSYDAAAMRFYSREAVKLGKATLMANTAVVVPIKPPAKDGMAPASNK